MGDEMSRAAERIGALCDEPSATVFTRWLSAARTWANANALYRRIGVARDRETILDHLATLRYALVFRSLGFLPSFEPTGPKGPDLMIARDSVPAIVEVTRFRPMNPGPLALGGDLLKVYGNPERDVAKALGKVKGKLQQATGPCAIIAVWNDDDALEDTEVRAALRDLQKDPDLPAGLQVVVYGSRWIGKQQLYSFPVRPQLDVHVQQWVPEFERVRVSAAIAAAIAAHERSAG